MIGGLDPTLVGKIARLRYVVFDFDGVFTDNTVYVFEDGREAVRCSRFDGLGLDKLRARGVGASVLSTERNPVVSARCRKLRLACVQGSEDKLRDLRALVGAAGVALEETAFVGNDINDAACLEAVGVPIVVADAHAGVERLAVYTTRTPGGRGAVREVCDLIAAVKGMV